MVDATFNFQVSIDPGLEKSTTFFTHRKLFTTQRLFKRNTQGFFIIADQKLYKVERYRLGPTFFYT